MNFSIMASRDCTELLPIVDSILDAYGSCLNLISDLHPYRLPEIVSTGAKMLHESFHNHQFNHIVDVLLAINNILEQEAVNSALPIILTRIIKKIAYFKSFIGVDLVNLIQSRCRAPCPFATSDIFAEAQSLVSDFASLTLADPPPSYEYPPAYPQNEMIYNFHFFRPIAEMMQIYFQIINDYPISPIGIRERDYMDFYKIVELRSQCIELVDVKMFSMYSNHVDKFIALISQMFALMKMYGKVRDQDYHKAFHPKFCFESYSFHQNCCFCFIGIRHCHLRPTESHDDCPATIDCGRYQIALFGKGANHNKILIHHIMQILKVFPPEALFEQLYTSGITLFVFMKTFEDALEEFGITNISVPNDEILTMNFPARSLRASFDHVYYQDVLHEFTNLGLDITPGLETLCIGLTGNTRLASIHSISPKSIQQTLLTDKNLQRELMASYTENMCVLVGATERKINFYDYLLNSIFQKFRKGLSYSAYTDLTKIIETYVHITDCNDDWPSTVEFIMELCIKFKLERTLDRIVYLFGYPTQMQISDEPDA